MTESGHAPYRQRLALLQNDATVVEPLVVNAPRQFLRRFERFEPGREPFATLVFEGGSTPERVFRVDVYSRPERAPAGCLIESDAGWLRRSPLEGDPCLPTLANVLDLPGRWRVARYLPFRRCTLCYVADEPNARAAQYVKVYANDRGLRAHIAGGAVWDAACQGELSFAVPKPDRWDSPTRALWQAALPGSPAAPALYGPHGVRMAARIGAALGSFTQSGLKPPRGFGASAQWARSMEIAAELARRVPDLADAVCQLLSRLEATHSRFDRRESRPIHGDPHADQWLDDGHRLGLLDFESVARGDPELDAAVFLAELEVEDKRQLPFVDLEHAFLDAFQSVAGRLDPQRLLAYRAHKRLAKALRSARAVRPDGDVRARAHLERALECVVA